MRGLVTLFIEPPSYNNLVGMWRKAVLAKFNILFWRYWGKSRETLRIISESVEIRIGHFSDVS
jgi:hypothetical protein